MISKELRERYANMANRAMARKLINGSAIDVATCKRDGPHHYVLTNYVDGKDYCDSHAEAWVWSIGRRLKDLKIIASLESDLYQHPNYQCLWLR